MSIRLIHAADFHLDSPFDGLDEEKAALRRREQRTLPRRVADLARRSGAELLLLAGDLLDSAQPYAETGAALRDALAELDIPVFIAPGNHDWYDRHSPYARLPFSDNVHIFRTPRLACAEVPALGLRVWGAGYTDRTCPPLLRDFRLEKQPGVKDVLLLHGEVGRPASPYCPMTEAELGDSGFDYAALGHIHKSAGLLRAGGCFYAWPGCPEGRGFDECGEKGALAVDIEPEECRARFVPLSRRQYALLRVEAGGDPLRAVEDALPAETQNDIYRIVLTGETEETLALQTLREALESRFFALSIRDETTPRRDIWERAGERSLRGLFLRKMREKLDAAPDADAQSTVLLAVRAGLAALDGREEPLC